MRSDLIWKCLWSSINSFTRLFVCLNLQISEFGGPCRNASPQKTRRKFAQVSGLLPDTNEQFVFHFFPNLHLSRLCFEVGNGKGRRVEGGGLGRWGGNRLCDTVFVFKEFRLAYKCADAHTFKVKQINQPETLFMAIMRRIFEERCKIVKDHEAKGTQIEVCQGVDDIFRCKVTS